MNEGGQGGRKRERPDDEQDEKQEANNQRNAAQRATDFLHWQSPAFTETQAEEQHQSGSAGALELAQNPLSSIGDTTQCLATTDGSAWADSTQAQSTGIPALGTQPLLQQANEGANPNQMDISALRLLLQQQEQRNPAVDTARFDSLLQFGSTNMNPAATGTTAQDLRFRQQLLLASNLQAQHNTTSPLFQMALSDPSLDADAINRILNLSSAYTNPGSAAFALPMNRPLQNIPNNLMQSLFSHSLESQRNLRTNISPGMLQMAMAQIPPANNTANYAMTGSSLLGGLQQQQLQELGLTGLFPPAAASMAATPAPLSLLSSSSFSFLNPTIPPAAASASLPEPQAVAAASALRTTTTTTTDSGSGVNFQDLPPPAPSDADSILLYTPADDTKLSPYQCLARQQLEFFAVGKDDLEAGAQGRNRPIVMGQIGIRCRHCARVPHRQKQRASTYFPAKLSGVYQTAQNITNTHLCQLCHSIPAALRRELQLLQSKKSGAGGGRKYWSESAEACGICEVEGMGLRFREALTPASNTATNSSSAAAPASSSGATTADDDKKPSTTSGIA